LTASYCFLYLLSRAAAYAACARGLPRFASKARDSELSRAAPKLAASELALARRTAGAEQAALFQADLRLELTAGT
jgi:hypothetical protein